VKTLLKGEKMAAKKWLADPENKKWIMDIVKWLIIIVLGVIAFRITNGVINKLAPQRKPPTIIRR